MVRNYVKKGSWEDSEKYEQNIPKALDAVRRQGVSLRKAAEKYGIRRETLRRHMKQFRENEEYRYTPFHDKLATRRVFSPEEDAELAEYFLSVARTGFPAPVEAARKMAYEFALRKGKQVPASWTTTRMAGLDWLSSFLHRNAVALRVPQGLSIARAEGFNPQTVQQFFLNLTRTYERYEFTPDKVFNMDETGLSTTAQSRRVLAKKGVRNVVQRTSADKGENVTLCGIVCANGNAVPPCLLFLRVRFVPSMLFGAPAGTLGLASRTGWMNSSLFLDVLKHFVQHVHCNPEKVLLVVDNHESRVPKRHRLLPCKRHCHGHIPSTLYPQITTP
jgi:transposase